MIITRIIVTGVLLATLALPACGDEDNPQSVPKKVDLVVAFPGLSFERPVDLQDPRDGTNRLFVVEQPGRVIVFENARAVSSSRVFLDIRSRVVYGGEQGLLGLAFDPAYAANGFFYVYYTVPNPLRTRLSRFVVSATDPDSADAASEAVVLEVDQPFSNHNGGQIAFGPDGYIYVGVGDGGSGGDPQGNGQNRATLLGKILRIDVSQLPYGIPADNPFAGNTEGYREEIFAWGLRNPWRFSFDTATGRLWAGDVGQSQYEEIDIVEKGKNYGWSIMEGNHCYVDPKCDKDDLALPLWEYGHDVGRSVTGGYVYHGAKVPEFAGAYVYGDFVTGIVWALRHDGQATPSNDIIADTDLSIASFGVDKDNEIYICAFDGKVYALEKVDAAP
jgi:glucose/arabinose dehydrogenase